MPGDIKIKGRQVWLNAYLWHSPFIGLHYVSLGSIQLCFTWRHSIMKFVNREPFIN